MMTNIRKISYRNVFLFDDTFSKQKFNNSLKEFIYYLRYINTKGVIDFSYASHSDSILSQLTIKDNFLLDSVPTSLIKDKEDNFRHNIDAINNEVLVELIEALQPLDRMPEQLAPEEIKLLSIVKALMARTDYIFLEQPEKNLSFNMLNKVKKCLEYEVIENNRTVFIKSSNKDNWLDLATDIITKESNKEYKKFQNNLCRIKKIKQENFKPTYSFSLIKKAI